MDFLKTTFKTACAAALVLCGFAAGVAHADDAEPACSGTVSHCNIYHGS